MTTPRATAIKRVRSETLVVLKMVYPTALQAAVLLRSLLAVFPQLEWEDFRKDLAYLSEKGYLARVTADSEARPELTALADQWYRLTAAGVEIADDCIDDPALEV